MKNSSVLRDFLFELEPIKNISPYTFTALASWVSPTTACSTEGSYVRSTSSVIIGMHSAWALPGKNFSRNAQNRYHNEYQVKFIHANKRPCMSNRYTYQAVFIPTNSYQVRTYVLRRIDFCQVARVFDKL